MLIKEQLQAPIRMQKCKKSAHAFPAHLKPMKCCYHNDKAFLDVVAVRNCGSE